MKIGTFNNNGTVVEIESVQTMNLHLDQGQVSFGEHVLQEFISSHTAAEDDTDSTAELHDALCRPQAEALLAKLCDAGVLDAHWQPVGLTNTERGLLAKILSDELGIDTPWNSVYSVVSKKLKRKHRCAQKRKLPQPVYFRLREQR